MCVQIFLVCVCVYASVYMLTCVCTCMHMSMNICVHAWVWRPKDNLYLLVFWDGVSHWPRASGADWLVSDPWRASCLCLPSAWITYVTHYGQLLLYMGHGNWVRCSHLYRSISWAVAAAYHFLGPATPHICVSVSAFLFCCASGRSIHTLGLFHTYYRVHFTVAALPHSTMRCRLQLVRAWFIASTLLRVMFS